MAALDRVNEGAVIVDSEEMVAMANACAKLMFGVEKDEELNWRVQDLLRKNEHLLEVYKTVRSGSEPQVCLMNTTFVAKNENRLENLLINFKCISIKTIKGESGSILLLFQPVIKH